MHIRTYRYMYSIHISSYWVPVSASESASGCIRPVLRVTVSAATGTGHGSDDVHLAARKALNLPTAVRTAKQQRRFTLLLLEELASVKEHVMAALLPSFCTIVFCLVPLPRSCENRH